MRILPSLCAVALTCASLTASPETSQPYTLSVQWDNDLFAGTDEGYTNGARIALTRSLPEDSEQHNRLQQLLRRLTGSNAQGPFNALRFPEAEAFRFQYGIGLSQLMFTPRDAEALTPPRGERPYAAWSGLEFSLQVSGDHSASTATLSIGTTGRLSYGQDLQNWIHENVSGSPLFKGWDSQAPGELTLNLHLDHKRRIQQLDATADWPLQVDGFTEWGTALGNFRTDVYLGTHFRVGKNLPNSHLTPRVQLGSFTETLFNHQSELPSAFSLYGFFGVRGYGVLHDITLDGPLARSWSESVNSEPWQGEISFGLAARYDSLELSFSRTLRTDEFSGQDKRSSFGSILLRLKGHF